MAGKKRGRPAKNTVSSSLVTYVPNEMEGEKRKRPATKTGSSSVENLVNDVCLPANGSRPRTRCLIHQEARATANARERLIMSDENDLWIGEINIPGRYKETYEEIEEHHEYLVKEEMVEDYNVNVCAAIWGVLDTAEEMKELGPFDAGAKKLLKFQRALDTAKTYNLNVAWLEHNLDNLRSYYEKCNEMHAYHRQFWNTHKRLESLTSDVKVLEGDLQEARRKVSELKMGTIAEEDEELSLKQWVHKVMSYEDRLNELQWEVTLAREKEEIARTKWVTAKERVKAYKFHYAV